MVRGRHIIPIEIDTAAGASLSDARDEIHYGDSERLYRLYYTDLGFVERGVLCSVRI